MEQESTKAQILKIATELFSEKGYDAVGVQEIVEKSGITKPTLYYYFGSKKGLLEAIVSENEERFYNQVSRAAEYKHLFFESLEEILRCEIDFASSYVSYFRLRMNLSNAPENSEAFKIFSPFFVRLETLLSKFFTLSAAEFGNMKGKEHLYSELFSSNACSIAMKAATGSLKINDEVLYSIVHSFVYGFAD